MKHGRQLLFVALLGVIASLGACRTLPSELVNTLGRLGFGGPWGPYARLAEATWVSPTAISRYEWIERDKVLRTTVEEAGGITTAVTTLTPEGDLRQEQSYKDKGGKPRTIVRVLRYEGGVLADKRVTRVKDGVEQTEQPDTGRRLAFDGADRLTVTYLQRGADGAWQEQDGYPLVRADSAEGQLRLADLRAARCTKEANAKAAPKPDALAAQWGAYATLAGSGWTDEGGLALTQYSWKKKGLLLDYRHREQNEQGKPVTYVGTVCLAADGLLVDEYGLEGQPRSYRVLSSVRAGHRVEQSGARVVNGAAEVVVPYRRSWKYTMQGKDVAQVYVSAPAERDQPEQYAEQTLYRVGSSTLKNLVARREAEQKARRQPWSLLSRLAGSTFVTPDGTGYQRFSWDVPNQRLREEWLHSSGGYITTYTARADGTLDLHMQFPTSSVSGRAWMLPGNVLHQDWDSYDMTLRLEGNRLVRGTPGKPGSDYALQRVGADGGSGFQQVARLSAQADAAARSEQAYWDQAIAAEQAAAAAEERAASNAMWGQAMAGLANGLSGNSTYGAQGNPLDEANRQTMERTRQIKEDLARQERERQEREERERIAADQQHARNVIAQQERERQVRQAEQARRDAERQRQTAAPQPVASAAPSRPRAPAEPETCMSKGWESKVSWWARPVKEIEADYAAIDKSKLCNGFGGELGPLVCDKEAALFVKIANCDAKVTCPPRQQDCSGGATRQ